MNSHAQFIKKTAAHLGFTYCGIAQATMLDEDAKRLESWLNKGFNGTMQYMENHFDKRVDPRKLVDDAKSVITLLYNYFPEEAHKTDGPKISKYAYGKDYHEVIKEKLHALFAEIKTEVGGVSGRAFVDSAPVLERAWAVKSGLGWVGKNGNLITKQQGSFFFIATLIIDLDLEYDNPYVKDYCGTCTACIDACPTKAILPNKTINGEQCISHYTIELKEALIPANMQGKFDNWAFGCDTCQDVCPWNRFSKSHTEAAFTVLPEILDLNTNEWLNYAEDEFKNIFKGSPLARAKWQGIQRNLKFLKEDKSSTE
jgi:epoxyqueuosine reductase